MIVGRWSGFLLGLGKVSGALAVVNFQGGLTQKNFHLKKIEIWGFKFAKGSDIYTAEGFKFCYPP